MKPPTSRNTVARSQGVVLIALMVTMTLMGLAVLVAAEVTATARQREREAQLLFVGEQYRNAIEHYFYSAPPGTPRMLPSTVEQLLLDDRYPHAVQHLRRPYADPFEGGDWNWVRIGDRLAGLHSRAHVEPLKQAGFPPRYAAFAAASDIAQWTFVFKPPAPTTRPGAAPAAARPSFPLDNINR